MTAGFKEIIVDDIVALEHSTPDCQQFGVQRQFGTIDLLLPAAYCVR